MSLVVWYRSSAGRIRAAATGARCARLAAIALAASATTGCSLSPQVFSHDLDPNTQQAVSGNLETVSAVTADIATVQRAYIGKVRGMSQLAPTTSAAIIGASALALYKGMTGGNTKDIIGLGALGSAFWAYGTNMSSRPRQLVYLEGFRALSCVATVAAPYNVEPAARTELTTRLSTASDALEGLRAWSSTYGYLNQVTRIPGKSGSKSCPAAPACRIPPGTSDDARKLMDAECKKQLKACKVVPPTPDKVVQPAPALAFAFTQVTDEQLRLERAIANGDRVAGALDMAGSKLREQSSRIQGKVAAEVLKTEPDPTAVLASLKNLRQIASSIAGTQLPAPAGVGSAQSGSGVAPEESERALTGEAGKALESLRSQLLAAFKARAALERQVAGIDQRVATIGKTYDLCEFTAPANSLTVSPAAAELQVPLGEKQQFLVSGGSGQPVGDPIALGGAKAGALERTALGSGGVVFEYAVPKKADGGKVGDRVQIVFKDGSGQAVQEVTVTAVEGNASEGTPPTTTTTNGTPAPDDTKPPK